MKEREKMIFENIRNLREDNDKKQQELADYLNVKQTTYSKYEWYLLGCFASLSNLYKISRLL